MQPITQSIFANNNLAIYVAPGLWQLSMRALAAENADSAELTPLIEAEAAGLRYQSNFAQARNLPGDLLPGHQVETVVVGWERKDGCWYLGLLLTPDLAQTRGGRWCGLARWSDPTGLIEFQAAEMAGRALADTLRRPFRLVTDQLRTESSATVTDTPAGSVNTSSDGLVSSSPDLAVETYDQPDSIEEPITSSEPPRLTGVVQIGPPVVMGDWLLAENANGLIWQHSPAWRNSMIVRMVFFGGLALLFMVLSIGALSSIFAPVQPDWLPLVGLVVSIVLVINVGLHLIRIFTASAVEFDQRLQMVRWQQPSKGILRQVPFEKVQYVLVSHNVLRTERLKGTTPHDVFDHLNIEAWLHVARDIGDFVEVGHIAPVEGRGVHQSETRSRQPLDLSEIDTPIHHAAQLIATAINVPAFIEQRT